MISTGTNFRVGFRIRNEFLSESFLQDIMGSLTNDSIGRILEFTAVPDQRKPIRAYGFFVELDGEIGIFSFKFTPRSTHEIDLLLFFLQDETLPMPSPLSKTSCKPTRATSSIPMGLAIRR
jgi:hypothetical protein